MERRGWVCIMGGVVSGNVPVGNCMKVWRHVAVAFVTVSVPKGDA
jgi:hypothetical protein